jgi:predicted RNA-binding Zn-ribbon protein involved in translation (DUF1610 family)
MREIVESLCPLCSTAAQFYTIDHGERNYYKCPTCTKFIITRSSENIVRQGSRGAELSALAKKATEGTELEVLEIAGGYMPSRPLTAEVVRKADYQTENS